MLSGLLQVAEGGYFVFFHRWYALFLHKFERYDKIDTLHQEFPRNLIQSIGISLIPCRIIHAAVSRGCSQFY